MGLALMLVAIAGCGETEKSAPAQDKAVRAPRFVNPQSTQQRHQEAAERGRTQRDLATAIRECSEGALAHAPNGGPLQRCTTTIERLGRDYEADGPTEQEARSALARIDWMHPGIATRGASSKEALGMVAADFGLVFAYTQSPPLPTGANKREPTCEGWQTAGEDDDAAYLARAGWPFRYLSQGLQTMDEVCSNVEARGLIPALGYLLCLSAPTAAAYLSRDQQREVIRGLQCGENLRPLHNEKREPSAAERQESQTQEAEHKEEEAKEEREKYKEPGTVPPESPESG